MKYNQQTHKQQLENSMSAILALLDIDQSRIYDVTFREIRMKLNELYPSTAIPVTDIEYDATKALIRDRKRIFNAARYTLYGLATIKNRENNV
jgi:hypothetical protein